MMRTKMVRGVDGSKLSRGATTHHFAALLRGRVVGLYSIVHDDPEQARRKAHRALCGGNVDALVTCPAMTVLGDWLDPRELQIAIAGSEEATRRVLAWLDEKEVEHSGRISGATLGAVCGVDGRAWRRWVGGESAMPLAASRWLASVAGVG